jgi:hypothetical protein
LNSVIDEFIFFNIEPVWFKRIQRVKVEKGLKTKEFDSNTVEINQPLAYATILGAISGASKFIS